MAVLVLLAGIVIGAIGGGIPGAIVGVIVAIIVLSAYAENRSPSSFCSSSSKRDHRESYLNRAKRRWGGPPPFLNR